MSGLLIIVVLFGLLWFVLIRPQRTKARAQQRMLGTVAPGDEILTVGGIYGIVQELEPDEDGGDLIVEIADGIHVRVARKALALVVKPEADEDDEETVDGEAEPVADAGELPAGELRAGVEEANDESGVEEVNDEGETVNPAAAGEAAPPGRS